LILLAARPSHGKSAVALQCIHEVTSHGRAAMMISEEMSALALGKRVIQYASDVPSEYWTHDANVQTHLADHFAGRADCLVVESCRTAEKAADEIRRGVEKHGVTFAVVDYAQLLGSKGNSRYEQITNTSITLRQVASQCKIPLLVLVQLSRAIEGRATFTPMMSDLKDSGQFEQDADVILFLCWPHRLDSTKDPNEYLFFVGKNRNRGIIKPAMKCRFEPGRQMFLPQGVDGPVDPFEERGTGGGEAWTG
jgi:replicative DNA helicase